MTRPTQGKMQGGGDDVSGAQTSQAHTNGNDDGAPPRLHGFPEEEADLSEGDKEGSKAPSLSGGVSATPGAKATPAGWPLLSTLPAQITPRRMSDSEAILSLSSTSLNSSSNFRYDSSLLGMNIPGFRGFRIRGYDAQHANSKSREVMSFIFSCRNNNC